MLLFHESLQGSIPGISVARDTNSFWYVLFFLLGKEDVIGSIFHSALNGWDEHEALGGRISAMQGTVCHSKAVA